ncbi:MAG: 4-hydroxy-tetrahydrodipicolinate synthase [Gammaproteobacteria bacterium CG_4_10_14_0_8_um_filter_38_16]|nr:MAG: 4-hydroxy-tetrahydrodipicolinate synthase [Gammaproteobacteria bacterium CG_4_10_14_0_8_um_filter_38_16]PJA03386.1 MAG: 4-hydroxy-tetrahydrodipicolinate synthase [Gammaproteobacteria bacterium CG_4_10_14_0_2_um_filter_38_22]PJB11126.1 MAG: 4-hydroxy-tetrahydrodipicolinate synthase [Gammaproteobacteria bacterium CG_4_9_14_3_um_filter_38_9]
MFHGSLVAIITPMQTDDSIDYAAFEKLIDWHMQNKTTGLVVLGTTGESATIESDERRELIRCAVARVHHTIPVIVGTGTNSTAQSILLTREAMALGADAVLLVTPYYNKPTQAGLFQHYRAIAQAVPIPQILYNVPGRTACDLLPETISRLSQFANIIGVKEATGDLNRLKKLLSLNLKMDFYSGDDATAMEFMLQGGQGVISVAANIVPKTFYELCVAALKKDRIAAEKINNQLVDLYSALFIESNPIPTKWVLQKMGLIQSGIRLPLTTLSVAHHAIVQSVMQQILI